MLPIAKEERSQFRSALFLAACFSLVAITGAAYVRYGVGHEDRLFRMSSLLSALAGAGAGLLLGPPFAKRDLRLARGTRQSMRLYLKWMTAAAIALGAVSMAWGIMLAHGAGFRPTAIWWQDATSFALLGPVFLLTLCLSYWQERSR